MHCVRHWLLDDIWDFSHDFDGSWDWNLNGHMDLLDDLNWVRSGLSRKMVLSQKSFWLLAGLQSHLSTWTWTGYFTCFSTMYGTFFSTSTGYGAGTWLLAKIIHQNLVPSLVLDQGGRGSEKSLSISSSSISASKIS